MMSSEEPSVSEVCRDDSPPLFLALSRPFLGTLCCVSEEGVAGSIVRVLSAMTLVASLNSPVLRTLLKVKVKQLKRSRMINETGLKVRCK